MLTPLHLKGGALSAALTPNGHTGRGQKRPGGARAEAALLERSSRGQPAGAGCANMLRAPRRASLFRCAVRACHDLVGLRVRRPATNIEARPLPSPCDAARCPLPARLRRRGRPAMLFRGLSSSRRARYRGFGRGGVSPHRAPASGLTARQGLDPSAVRGPVPLRPSSWTFRSGSPPPTSEATRKSLDSPCPRCYAGRCYEWNAPTRQVGLPTPFAPMGVGGVGQSWRSVAGACEGPGRFVSADSRLGVSHCGRSCHV